MTETTNLSKIKRDKMIDTLKEIKKNITDEKTLDNLSLIENELTKKKYGLIWEEHEERVDKELRTQIPTFEEVKNKAIVNDKKKKFNFLLEGDNLHSLYLLQKTHKGKIDLIIIDPPYNTENKEFIYDDNLIGLDDEYRHSKWLSFMHRRLTIAKKLLTKEGLIFIHIDDNEQANLKLLCDAVFDEKNFVNCIAVKMSEPTGVKMAHVSKRLPKLKEYILLYKNETVDLKNIKIPKDKWDEEYKILIENVTFEEISFVKKVMQSEELTTNQIEEADRICSKFKFTNVNTLFKNGLKEEEILQLKYDNAWRIVRDVATTGGAKKIADDKRKKTNGSSFLIITPQKKVYLIKNDYNENVSQPRIKLIFADEYLTVNPCDFWQDIKTTGLNNEGFVDFRNGKKPLKLEKRLLELDNKDAIVLDFFAGSGTTGQAVLELNKEDGGNRQFILCTNNENGICEQVTYPRLKGVIYGINDKNIKIREEINSNLKYYKTSYIPRINNEECNLHEKLLINIKNLIQLENGIEIDDELIKVYLDESNLDKFSLNKKELDECEKLYISSDILLTSEQLKKFKDYNIEVFIIPEYYFTDEIMEVA